MGRRRLACGDRDAGGGARGLFATVVLAAGLAACSGGDEGDDAPQAGVAPRGASAVDAGVTNGAITYNTRDLIGLMADEPSQAERFDAATLAGTEAGRPAGPSRAASRPQGHARLLRRRPQLGQQPSDPQVRGRAAGRRRRRGQRPRPVHPGGHAGHGHLPRLRLLRDRRARVLRAAAQRPARDAPARLRAAQLGHRRERAQLGQPGAHPLPRAAHPRPARPAGARQVRQPAAAGRGRRPLPAGGHDDQGRRRRPPGGDDVYPQNRASLRLHGGLTPWISGGSQYQWITPAGERSPYRSGPSLVNVPDMWFDAQGRPVDEGTPGATNDPGPGATTLYFPNDQSARFLYLHDDTYGLTRLSVYAGEAAPYLIGDDVEDELVADGPARSRPPSCRSSSRTRPSSPRPRSSAPRTRPGTSPAGAASARCGIRTSTCPTRTPPARSTPRGAGTTCPGTGRATRAPRTARWPTRSTATWPPSPS